MSVPPTRKLGRPTINYSLFLQSRDQLLGRNQVRDRDQSCKYMSDLLGLAWLGIAGGTWPTPNPPARVY